MNQKSPRAAVVTLGCPMNQTDSERIMGGLVSSGFELVPEDEADVIVVNTCGFIESAREESIETILELAGLKETGRARALVVAGCLAELRGEELRGSLDEADAVVGLSGRDSIPGLCLRLLGREQAGEEVYTRVVTGPRHSAYLKIAEGCDNVCTYCTIPAIRGRFRSVPEDEVIREAEELAALGARELILIGQDTTSYGADFGRPGLPGLIEKLASIEDIRWLRLMYAHPSRIGEGIIDTFRNIPKLLPYIDLPLQHISGDILRRMGRRTPPDDIRALIARLRDRIPGVVLRTSLIAGFPGETEAQFEELLAFMEETKFERLGAFVYSPEEGTPAARLDSPVPPEVAEERYDRIMRLQAEITEEFQRSLVGGEFDMIVDEIDPDSEDVFGRIYTDAPDIDGVVSVAGGIAPDAEFVRVRIVESGTYDLVAEPAGDE